MVSTNDTLVPHSDIIKYGRVVILTSKCHQLLQAECDANRSVSQVRKLQPSQKFIQRMSEGFPPICIYAFIFSQKEPFFPVFDFTFHCILIFRRLRNKLNAIFLSLLAILPESDAGNLVRGWNISSVKYLVSPELLLPDRIWRIKNDNSHLHYPRSL